MRSPDHGQTWEVIDALPQSGRWITGMARGAALVVATTQISQLPNDARILVSGGGLEWIEVVIDTEQISTLCILWDGNRFWAGGTEGRIYRSFDGMNWTILRTPVNTSFQALAWSGSRLIAQGTLGPAVTTPDGGETWKTYDLGFDHESRGLAFGAGRYVSVGSAPGGGAIFSTP
jgi:photosystem II stability/assembly factor-like uncharacterized protein